MKIYKGDIDVSDKFISKFPNWLSEIIIDGNFYCGYNRLTSLEGAPREVRGSFDCSSNEELTSLQGAPKYIGGRFDCSGNELTSLQGAPEYIGDSFDCSYNELTSLQGAPKVVNGDFYCYNNKIEFTEEQVREVCNVSGDVHYIDIDEEEEEDENL